MGGSCGVQSIACDYNPHECCSMGGKDHYGSFETHVSNFQTLRDVFDSPNGTTLDGALKEGARREPGVGKILSKLDQKALF